MPPTAERRGGAPGPEYNLILPTVHMLLRDRPADGGDAAPFCPNMDRPHRDRPGAGTAGRRARPSGGSPG